MSFELFGATEADEAAVAPRICGLRYVEVEVEG